MRPCRRVLPPGDRSVFRDLSDRACFRPLLVFRRTRMKVSFVNQILILVKDCQPNSTSFLGNDFPSRLRCAALPIRAGTPRNAPACPQPLADHHGWTAHHTPRSVVTWATSQSGQPRSSAPPPAADLQHQGHQHSTFAPAARAPCRHPPCWWISLRATNGNRAQDPNAISSAASPISSISLWERAFPRAYVVRRYPFQRGHPVSPRPARSLTQIIMAGRRTTRPVPLSPGRLPNPASHDHPRQLPP